MLFVGLTVTYFAFWIFRFVAVRRHKVDLAQVQTEEPRVGELLYATTAQFCVDNLTYAADSGILVLSEGHLIFDGQQTTFSLPLSRPRVRRSGDVLHVSYPGSRLRIKFYIPELFLDAQVLALAHELRALPASVPKESDDMLPPLFFQKRWYKKARSRLLRRSATVSIATGLLCSSALGPNWSLLITFILAVSVAIWQGRVLTRAKQLISAGQQDPRLVFETAPLLSPPRVTQLDDLDDTTIDLE